MNSNTLDAVFESDVAIDLDSELGLSGGTYTVTNMDTLAQDSNVKGTYTFDNGGRYQILAKDSDDTSKLFTVKVTGLADRTFEWKSDGESYEYTIGIDYDDYLYSVDLYTISERRADSRNDHAHDKTFVTLSYTDSVMKPYMDTLVTGLIDEYSKTHSSVDEVKFLDYILAFTQYIKYEYDEEAMSVEEYWKFPLETLYDQGGDCEDTSILFIAIAHQARSELDMSYGTALQLLPGHMCGAIKLTDSKTYTTNPTGYVYCETTSTGYSLGEIPTSTNNEIRDHFTQQYYYTNGYSTTIEIK